MVTTFKYLGRVVMELYENWPEMVENMRKLQRRWPRLSSILWRKGADPWASGTFYKAVVQANFMFGSETWVMTPGIGKTFGSFQYRVQRRLARMRPR